MKRLIFHVDVNSVFLSWEAVRRLEKGEADIRLIPSAISGDPLNRTGVILAKSMPAKSYNIRTGEPVGMALRKCPDLFLARPDFKLYEKNSRAFMNICRRYTPCVEKFSIDECFMDMTGMEKLYPVPLDIAYRLKEEIKAELGFTVNVGAGPNKLLAKTASDWEKPDRVHTLFREEIENKFWPLPVGELYTVGRATAQKLERAGIRTIGELASASLPHIQSMLGRKAGKRLYEYANGIDFSPVLEEPEEAKGYNISITLAEDVVSFEEANRILLELTDSVTARLRAARARARCVGICIRSRDFKNSSHQRRLAEATDVTDEIYKLCKELLEELWREDSALRLLGISLTQIVRDSGGQMTLFDEEKRERARKLDRTVDDIRSRYGADAIKRGAVFVNPVNAGKKYRALMEYKDESE